MFFSSCSSGGVLAYADAKSDHDFETSELTRKKKLVVLGTGWAGTSFLRNLDASQYDVQVVSPRNYFLFTPLLPSVTCGTVEPRSIVEPIRKIMHNVRFQYFNGHFLFSIFAYKNSEVFSSVAILESLLTFVIIVSSILGNLFSLTFIATERWRN